MQDIRNESGLPTRDASLLDEALILAVDDREANLIALEQTLKGIPARLILATSGDAALSATLRHNFALAILDVQMPGMDGYELAEILLSDPATAHTPIIFVTAAYSDDAHRFKGYTTGAVDYIVKPFEPAILISKVRVFLELARQRHDLQQTRESLKFERRQLLSILNNLHNFVYVLNPESGNVLFANRAAAGLTGNLSPGNPGALPVHDLDKQVSNFVAGMGQKQDGNKPGWEREIQIQGRTLHLSEQIIQWPDGRLALLAIGNDITAQKLAESALARSEANYRTFFETISDMIIVATPDGQVTFANRAMEQRLGYSDDEITRMRVIDFHPKDRHEEAVEIFSDMMKGTRKTCTLPLIAKNGALVPVETRIWSGLWNEKECIFGLSKDLTAEIEAQHRFERLFRGNPSPMVLTTVSDRCFFDVNDAFVNVVGYPREAVVGKTSDELGLFTHPEEHRTVRDKLLTEGRIADVDLQIRCKDGRIIEGLFSGDIIRSHGNEYLLTVMTDITARKQAEKTLARKQRQAEIVAAMALSPGQAGGAVQELAASLTETVSIAFGIGRVGVWLFEENGTRLVNVDNYLAATDMHSSGAVLPEHEYRDEFAVLHRDKYVASNDPLTDPRLSGYVKDYLKPNHITAMLDAVIRLEGTAIGTICFEHVDTPHRWEEDEIIFACQLADQMALSVGNARRRKVEESLRERDHQLRDVLNNQFELICRFLPDGTLTFVNEAYCRYFQKSEKDLIGNRFLPMIPDEDKAYVTERFSSLTKGNPVITYEHRVILPSGEIGWMQWTDIAFFDGKEKLIEFQAAGRDITLQKRSEESLRETNRQLEAAIARANRMAMAAEQANATKTEFLANMSHELRTPLNAILALSETLLEQVRGPLNARQEKAMHDIEASGRHLLELINDVLDLAKVEAGRLDIAPEWIPVSDVCESSLAFVREMAISKNLMLRFQADDSVTRIKADPKRLRQMLVNLLSNAVKFTPNGGRVSLTVTAIPDQGAVGFEVADTGIGIRPEDWNRLFSPFTQLDSSLSRSHEGTGLGLVLVQRLAEMHGGSVAVESEPGKGSRFTLLMPCGSPVAGSSLPEMITVTSDQTAPSHTALLVEDSEIAAGQIAGYLEEMGFEIMRHPCGEGVLEKTTRIQPAVIVLDLLLPDLSGWEVLAQLKADPKVSGIPVLIVSVVDEPSRARAAGAAGHALKPVSRQSLRKALESAMGIVLSGEGLKQTGCTGQTYPKILLAEDNEANIHAIGEYLEDRGFLVTIACNGREALERAVVGRPDVILMDIQMPEMDGLEATRRLREIPACKNVPVIALTALAMPGDREQCLAAGANEYMTKPVSLKALITTIWQLLDEQKDPCLTVLHNSDHDGNSP